MTDLFIGSTVCFTELHVLRNSQIILMGGKVTEEIDAFPLSHSLIKTHRLAAR